MLLWFCGDVTLSTAAIPLGLLYALILLVGSAQCILTSGHTDVYVVEGSTVVLPCSTNRKVPVIWIYNRSGGDVDLFLQNMRVDKDQTHNQRVSIQMGRVQEGAQYNLMLIDVQLEDAGTYRCVDDEGFGYDNFLEGLPNRVATVQLNVIGNDLKCWSNINITSLKEETFSSGDQYCSMIIIHCNIKFGGSAPTLKWSLLKNSSNSAGISLQKYSDRTVKQNSKYSTVTSKLQLSATERLTNSYIRCDVINSGKGMNTAWQIFGNETIASKVVWFSQEIIVQDNAEIAFSTDCTPSIEIKSVVNGVTVVDDEIFLIGDTNSHVSVYDLHSLKFKRDINIPGLGSPQGLAGCSHNKALYISDWLRGCIHRVDLKNNETYLWNLRENHKPRGLSVTVDHTLLVTAWISQVEGEKIGTSGESIILEYTSEGEIKREIIVHKSIELVMHTIQLSSDRFIITHGVGYAPLHRVCVINSEGDTIQCYGFEAGQDEGRLNEPNSLAIDFRSELIFVADCKNNRVLLLDKDLKYIDRIRATSDLRGPYNLYFDPSIERLLIGEKEERNGRLLIISPPL